MRARPIPFTSDMVLAILDDRKTETRRPVKAGLEVEHRPANGDTVEHWMVRKPGDTVWANSVLFQPWNPGYLLWVREPGSIDYARALNDDYYVQVRYSADELPSGLEKFPRRLLKSGDLPRWALRFQGIPNGIFREACRLVLEVVTVRVERVQDITEEGAKAEGVTPDMIGACDCNGEPSKPYEPHLVAFADLWDSIYASKGLSWDANPWVWVVGFKVAAKTHSEAQKALEGR